MWKPSTFRSVKLTFGGELLIAFASLSLRNLSGHAIMTFSVDQCGFVSLLIVLLLTKFTRCHSCIPPVSIWELWMMTILHFLWSLREGISMVYRNKIITPICVLSKSVIMHCNIWLCYVFFCQKCGPMISYDDVHIRRFGRQCLGRCLTVWAIIRKMTFRRKIGVSVCARCLDDSTVQRRYFSPLTE